MKKRTNPLTTSWTRCPAIPSCGKCLSKIGTPPAPEAAEERPTTRGGPGTLPGTPVATTATGWAISAGTVRNRHAHWPATCAAGPGTRRRRVPRPSACGAAGRTRRTPITGARTAVGWPTPTASTAARAVTPRPPARTTGGGTTRPWPDQRSSCPRRLKAKRPRGMRGAVTAPSKDTTTTSAVPTGM